MILLSMHYFPVTPLFMVLLFVALTVLVALIQFGVITYAYEKMGVGRGYILGVLLLSLLGSAINIPIAALPAKDIVVERAVNYFGVGISDRHYRRPAGLRWQFIQHPSFCDLRGHS
jgi:uncharacterized membrane protein